MPLVVPASKRKFNAPSLLKPQRASASAANLELNSTMHLQDSMPREWRDLWLWQHMLNCVFAAVRNCDFVGPVRSIFMCMKVCRAWHSELGVRLLLRLQEEIRNSSPQRINFCSQIGLSEYESFFRFLFNLNASPEWHSPEQISTCAMHISSTSARQKRKKSICICTSSYPVNVRTGLALPLTKARRFMVIFVTRYSGGEMDSEEVIVTEVERKQGFQTHTAHDKGTKLTDHLLTLVTPQLG